MAWQDVFTPSEPGLDADQEQEARLAAQARAGAEWALTALIARYQPPVVRYLTRLTGSQEHARTLAERIFIRMERRLHGPHGAQRLRLWLLRASTEAGLDVLRHPHRKPPARLTAPPGPKALLSEHADSATESASDRLKNGLGKIAKATQSTSRQVRQLIWTLRAEATGSSAPDAYSASAMSGARNPSPLATATELHSTPDDDLDTLDPREALRHRLVRVVLAELSYGDAQCLALHLVAGLNQAEVAQALGLTASATRKRVVQGLQTFSARYASALTSMGVSPELGYQRPSMPEPQTPPEHEAVLPSAGFSPLSDMETLRRWDAERVVESVEQEPTIRALWPPAAPEPDHDSPEPAYSAPATPAVNSAQFVQSTAPVAETQAPDKLYGAPASVPLASVDTSDASDATVASGQSADESDAYAPYDLYHPQDSDDADDPHGLYDPQDPYAISASHDASDGYGYGYGADTIVAMADPHDSVAVMSDVTLPGGTSDDTFRRPEDADVWNVETITPTAAAEAATVADTVTSVDWEPVAHVAPQETTDLPPSREDDATPLDEATPVADAMLFAPDDDEVAVADTAATVIAGATALSAPADETLSGVLSTDDVQPEGGLPTDASGDSMGEASAERATPSDSAARPVETMAAQAAPTQLAEDDDGAITQPSLRRIAAQQRKAAEASASRPANPVEPATPSPSAPASVEQAEPERPDPTLAERLARVQRNGTVSPMAHDAIIGPVVDALPITPIPGSSGPKPTYPAGSTRRQTSQPLTFEMAAALAPVWIAPTEPSGASAGSEDGDTALTYEAPLTADPDQLSHQRNDNEQA